MLPKRFQQILARQVDIDGLIIDCHHEMMKEYGWISIEEFRKMPIPAFWNLFERITIDRERRNNAIKKRGKYV